MMLDEEHVPEALRQMLASGLASCKLLCCAVHVFQSSKVTDARNGSVAYTHADQSSANHQSLST
jgi:hypothetical protein